MIAPQAEAIPPSPLLDLALRSRQFYPDWINQLEEMTGLDTGYFPCGILTPVYDASKEPESPTVEPATWVEKTDLEFYQSGLGQDVVGAWWYPEDSQVDNRALMKALTTAAKQSGVTFRDGVTVKSIQRQNGRVTKVRTTEGEFQADHYVLATGSWVKELLPMPVRPLKGQMMSLRMPTQPYPIQQVLFGPDIYFVPRQDGRLIVGATVEDVGWTGNNTPAGIKTLSDRAIRLYPDAADWAMEETWWGYRPTTPDHLPILGQSDCDNLFLATGHHRHGVLLAPITAELIADFISNGKADPLSGDPGGEPEQRHEEQRGRQADTPIEQDPVGHHRDRENRRERDRIGPDLEEADQCHRQQEREGDQRHAEEMGRPVARVAVVGGVARHLFDEQSAHERWSSSLRGGVRPPLALSRRSCLGNTAAARARHHT